jgi:preprotein translocase subunit SecD
MRLILLILSLFIFTSCNSQTEQITSKSILNIKYDFENNKKSDLVTGFYWVDFLEKGIRKETFIDNQRFFYYLEKQPFITSKNFKDIQSFNDGKNWNLRFKLDEEGKSIFKTSSTLNLYENFGFVVNGHLVCTVGITKPINSGIFEIVLPRFSKTDVEELKKYILISQK